MNEMYGAPVIGAFPISLKQIIKEKPFLFLILIEFLFFWRPVFFGEVFYFRDLTGHFQPVRQLVAEYIRQFEPPLWEPFRQGGKPLLANPNNMALYPANLLYLFLQPGTALNVEIIGHHLLGLLAAYVLARFLGISSVFSFIAAMIYSFAGYSLSLMNLLNWHIAASHLPVLLCLWHVYLTTRKKIWWGLCVLIVSIQVLAGAPELSVISLITVLGWGLFYPYSCGKRKVATSFLLLIVFVAAITAVQLLPALENARVTIRAVGFSFDSATNWSLHPYRFAEFFFPGLPGNYNSLSGTTFWGEKLTGSVPFFLSVYFGLPAIAFAFSTIFCKRESLVGLRRFHFFLLGMMFFSLILAMGRHLPFLRWIFEQFSARFPFRFPIKIIGAAILPMSLLAGIGAQTLFSGTRKRRVILISWTIAIALFLLLFLVQLFSPAIIETLFQRTPGAPIQEGLNGAVLHTLLIWIVVCLCLTLHHKRNVLPLFGLIIALDLFVAGQNVNFYAPKYIYTDKPGMVDVVKQQVKDGKLYRTGSNIKLSKTPTDELVWRVWAQQQTLFDSTAARYKIPVMFHDDLDGSALLELNYVSVVIANLTWRQKLPVLAASGVTAVLTDQIIQDDHVHLVRRMSNPYGRELLLYSIDNALPPASFATQSTQADSARQALLLMTQPQFHPAHEIVIGGGPAQSFSECGSFRVLHQQLQKQERSFVVENGCPGYLLFSDPHYPGWHVRVNGKKAELLKANIIFSAIYLPAGRHEIRKIYLPRTVIIGAWCSFIGVACLFILVFTRAGNFLRLNGA